MAQSSVAFAARHTIQPSHVVARRPSPHVVGSTALVASQREDIDVVRPSDGASPAVTPSIRTDCHVAAVRMHALIAAAAESGTHGSRMSA
jgi:hypothetical protein